MSPAALTCAGCGAPQSAPKAVRQAGWFRCEYCGQAAATPASGWEAVEGPASSAVILRRGSQLRLILPAGRLLGLRALIASWFFLAFGLFGVSTALQLDPAANPVIRWGLPGLLALGALAAAVYALALRRSEQRLDVSPTRLRASRHWGEHEWAVAERSFRRGRLEVEAEPYSDAAWSNLAWRVCLTPAGGDPLIVRCHSEREARWVARLIGATAADAPAPDLACRSCGAPLEVTPEARADQALTCGFCGAGYLLEGEELRWGPVRLPAGEAPTGGSPGHVAVEPVRGGQSWRIRPGELVLRGVCAVGLLANTAFFGGFAAAGLFWLAPEVAGKADTPPAALGLLGCAALLFGFVAGFAAVAAVNVLAGQRRLTLADGALTETLLLAGREVPRFLQLGGWDTYRALWFDRELRDRVNIFVGFTDPLARRVPVLRLEAVEVERRGGQTDLLLRTPARTLTFSFRLPEPASAWLIGTVLTALRDELERLERPVTVAE